MAADTARQPRLSGLASAPLRPDLPALVWNVDTNRGGFGFNNAWLQYSAVTEAQLGGNGWLAVVHADDRPKLAFLQDQSFSAPRTLDIRLLDAQRRYCWFLVCCGDLNTTSARTLVALSIDERKLAELALERELADAREMLANAPTMMWRTTSSGEMDYANDRYLKAWGRTLDEVKGWGWKDAVHPDDRQGLVDYWEAHRFTARDGLYEFRLGNPHKGYRWCLSVCSASLDDAGNVRRWYGATFDIEDRKQAEERLRRSEAFLRQGQMISMTGSVAVNRVTGEHYWSEEAYRIFGLDRSVTPSFEALLTRVHRDDRAQVVAAIASIRSGQSDVSLEFRAVMPDHQVKYLRALVSPRHAQDLGANATGVIMDITAAKLAEEEMNRAQSDLTRVTRIATMAELTASIAHEINQPISGVLTNSEACLRWLNRPQPHLGEARQAVERTVVGARRVSDVVQQLRAIFARRDPEPTRFDLGELIASTLPLLRSHMTQHRASVTLDIDQDAPAILADQVQVQQVLINMVMNGLQAPRLKSAGRRLIVETSHGDSAVTLCVSDDGPGIDKDSLSSIFEPFFTTKPEGMGMGLSICRSIVESYGGTIFARESAMGGATVGFTFPVKA